MKKITLVLFAATLLLSSCQKEPDACFTFTDNAIAGETVTFSNCTVDGDHFEWHFNDGTILTGSSATHAFATAGSHSVQLTAYSKNEKKQSVTVQTITIVPATGQATFWAGPGTFTPDLHIGIIVGSSEIFRDITQSYTVPVTACGTVGCANFTLEVGSYGFVASASNGYYQQGSVTVTASGCTVFEVD